MIKHVWFDTSGTLYQLTPEFKAFHDQYLYPTYAKIVGENDLGKAKKDYDRLLDKYSSNSAVFNALGMPPGFWQKEFDNLDVNSVLRPDPVIAHTLKVLKDLVPISVFTNVRLAKLKNMLNHLEVPISYFTNVLTGENISEPKPDLEGFRKMIEVSKLPPDELLYIGDKVDKDVRPAKQLGMKTCIVWSKSLEADFSAATFKDLLGIITSAINR